MHTQTSSLKLNKDKINYDFYFKKVKIKAHKLKKHPK